MNRRETLKTLFVVACSIIVGVSVPRWVRLPDLRLCDIDDVIIMPDGTGTCYIRYHGDGRYHSYEWTEHKLWVDGQDLTEDFTLFNTVNLNKVWVRT